jgi:hypothetical protein
MIVKKKKIVPTKRMFIKRDAIPSVRKKESNEKRLNAGLFNEYLGIVEHFY